MTPPLSISAMPRLTRAVPVWPEAGLPDWASFDWAAVSTGLLRCFGADTSLVLTYKPASSSCGDEGAARGGVLAIAPEKFLGNLMVLPFVS
ncbi:hypothetical protein MSHI_19690 [Mycobacterium shinjukuense]|uniref:Uncharacterized protein n=1 Tax=Mycobacterium shinjukuense TaxID=398694 RepID=A0A7I7MR86_9MYCO|nr:hypothetical protein MSHI_19690 [Mycobacterium shinjukuense]